MCRIYSMWIVEFGLRTTIVKENILLIFYGHVENCYLISFARYLCFYNMFVCWSLFFDVPIPNPSFLIFLFPSRHPSHHSSSPQPKVLIIYHRYNSSILLECEAFLQKKKSYAQPRLGSGRLQSAVRVLGVNRKRNFENYHTLVCWFQLSIVRF